MAQSAPETTEVRAAHRFDPADLERWMAANVEGFRGPLQVKQFSGGQSNPTYLLSGSSGKYVLRRKPPGQLLPSAHAVDREFRVMKALAQTDVPVPRMHALCSDDSVIGSMFFVMDHVAGRQFWDPTLPDQTKAERTAMFDAMNKTIAALHSADYVKIGLADYGKPGNYFARQIGRWSQQYRASETEKIDAMEQLMEWLPQHIPPGEETGIVHGDLRIDNMLFHATEPRVIALLDWELSTLGDPRADIGYMTMGWRLSGAEFRGMAGADFAALGIPTEEQFIADWCRRTGRAPLGDATFYLAYNMFRLAAILQGVLKRGLDGNASSDTAIATGQRGRLVAEAGWRMIKNRT
jgi:aminoglycoside phosphotransferase (APT) family kinase protein